MDHITAPSALLFPLAETAARLRARGVAVLADGDLVTVVLPREYPHPVNEGETYTTIWADMWRFVDGKADEHWDTALIN